jgi:hypothetical protein
VEHEERRAELDVEDSVEIGQGHLIEQLGLVDRRVGDNRVQATPRGQGRFDDGLAAFLGRDRMLVRRCHAARGTDLPRDSLGSANVVDEYPGAACRQLQGMRAAHPGPRVIASFFVAVHRCPDE